MDCYRQFTEGRWYRTDKSEYWGSEEEGDYGRSSREGSARRRDRKESERLFLGESSKACPSPLVTEMQEEQQLRRSTRKQATESCSGAFPILIKGDQAQYVPWGSHKRWCRKMD